MQNFRRNRFKATEQPQLENLRPHKPTDYKKNRSITSLISPAFPEVFRWRSP